MTKDSQLTIAEYLIKTKGTDCCGVGSDCAKCNFTELCPNDDAGIVEMAEKYVKSFKEE